MYNYVSSNFAVDTDELVFVLNNVCLPLTHPHTYVYGDFRNLMDR